MADTLSMRNKLRLALPIAFLAAAAIAGCTGVGEMREDEHGAGESGEEESRVMLTLDQPYDGVRNGARLIMRYDREANAFVGTVQNITDATLPMVRVEVHLSNGTELGPTTPVDLAPDQIIEVTLEATSTGFTGWTAHPESGPGHGTGEHGEHGEGGEGGEGAGEHGEGGERGGEHGGG